MVMLNTLVLILALAALFVAIWSAVSKPTVLWVAVVLLCLAMLIAYIPVR